MAFGQSSGPPATGKQLRELEELLEAAGHSDFRDARGPMGFTQRQAGGKFTRDEADEFIAALHEAAESADSAGEAPEASPEAPSAPAPRPKAASRGRAEAPLGKFTDQQLAAELQRRGWVVMEP